MGGEESHLGRAAGRALEGEALLGRGELSVQRQHVEPRAAVQPRLHVGDLARTWQKDERRAVAAAAAALGRGMVLLQQEEEYEGEVNGDALLTWVNQHVEEREGETMKYEL